MEERLNELIKILKERDTVRKILQAKDVKAVYEEEKVAMKEQLECFSKEVYSYSMEIEYPIPNDSEVICPENIVEFCFILMMAGIDDMRLVDDYGVILSILNEVDGDLKEISRKFNEFLDDWCFTEYTEEEVLEKIVL